MHDERMEPIREGEEFEWDGLRRRKNGQLRRDWVCEAIEDDTSTTRLDPFPRGRYCERAGLGSASWILWTYRKEETYDSFVKQ